ncbi:hypothetical protein [Bifidobacterium margollesii]|uniref:hypothetical protein n=1 Tax=Bifidobacterium margollesii TaxID=2020964 RepID=UPI0013FD9678|nr:hypothetical protein [Bifidobacterium margollesii]
MTDGVGHVVEDPLVLDSVVEDPGRDAWIRTLPKSAGHCFDCGTWANDRGSIIPEPAKPRTKVPERWTRLTPLLEARYPQSENTEQQHS